MDETMTVSRGERRRIALRERSHPTWWASVAALALLVGAISPAEAATPPTALVSRSSQGPKADGNSVIPSTSRNGRFVAFQSQAANLPGGDGSTLLVYRQGPR